MLRSCRTTPRTAMAYTVLAIRPIDDQLTFRTSTVLPRSRLWLRGGEPVVVGSRVFDLLVALLAFRGEVRGKAEIMHYVWPDTIVSEENVRFQMVALRRALASDADLIKTIPGRGYLFAEDVPPALYVGGRRHSATIPDAGQALHS